MTYAAEYADYVPDASGEGYLRLHRGKIGAGPFTTPRANPGLSRPPETLYESIFQQNGGAAESGPRAA